MADDQAQSKQERKDFFISYTSTDRQWAEWIAWQLEEATYRVIIQAWDFRPGTNFVAEMDTAAKHADRTLLVLSAAYLTSDYAFAEWAAAFRHDAKGKQGRVLPVRIQKCEVEGLLGSIVYIDLVGQDEAQARGHLLAGVQRERAKPATVPFPVESQEKRAIREEINLDTKQERFIQKRIDEAFIAGLQVAGYKKPHTAITNVKISKDKIQYDEA